MSKLYILLLCIACWGCSLTASSQNIRTKLLVADSLYLSNKYEDARKMYLEVSSFEGFIDSFNASTIIQLHFDLAFCYMQLDSFVAASESFKNAYGISADSLVEKSKLDYFYYLQELYPKWAKTNPESYKIHMAERYQWETLYIPIDSVYRNASNELIARIPMGVAYGLEDEIISVMASNLDDKEYAFEITCQGDYSHSDSSFSYYKLREKELEAEQVVEKRDFLLVECNVPKSDGDELAFALINNCRFLDNYKADLLSFALFFSKDYDFYKPWLEKYAVYQLQEIYDLFAEDSIPSTYIPSSSGLYKGRTVMEVMKNCEWQDLEKFMIYATDHMGSYIGFNYLLSNSFATWLLNGASFSSEQLTDILIELKLEDRITAIHNYSNDIKDRKLLKLWADDCQKKLGEKRLVEALDLADLGIASSIELGDKTFEANFLMYRGQIYSGLNQDQRSTSDLIRSKEIYGQLNDKVGLQNCDNIISELAKGNKISVVVQGMHSMPFLFVYHPNGQYFYTAGWDGIIKMWENRSGLIYKQINGHKKFINGLTISGDGQFLLTADDDGNIRAWNALSLELAWEYKHKESINEVDINYEGSKIIFCGYSKNAFVLEVDKMKIIQLKRHEANVTAVKFHPTKDEIITGSRDSMMYKWSSNDYAYLGWFKNRSQIYSLNISPNGRTLVAVLRDSTIQMWDYFEYNKIGNANTPFKKMGTNIFFCTPTFSNDSRYMVYILKSDKDYLSFVRLSDLNEHNFNVKHEDIVSSLAFHPAGNYLVSVGHDVKIKLYDLANYKFQKTHTLSIVNRNPSACSALTSAFDTTGDHLIFLVNGENYVISSLNLTNGQRTAWIQRPMVGDKHHYINKHDNRLQYFDWDSKFHSIDLKNGTHEEYYTSIDNTYNYVVSPKGKIGYFYKVNSQQVLAINLAFDDTIFNVSVPFTYDGFSTDNQIAINAEENYLLFASKNDKIYKMDAHSGILDSLCILKGKEDGVLGIISTKTSGLFLIHTNKFIGLYNLDKVSWNWKYAYNNNNELMTCIALTEDLKYLALGTDNYELRIVEPISKEIIYTFGEFGWFVTSVAFHPTLPIVVATSEDLQVYLLNYEKEALVLKIFPQNDGEMILMNAEGAYWADRNSMQGLAFRLKNTMYPIEQFDLYYNQPNEVLKKLPNADNRYLDALEKATQKRLIREGISSVSLSQVSLPNTYIVNRRDIPDISNSSSVNLLIECTDFVDSLESLHISVNGVPIFGVEGFAIHDNHFFKRHFEINLSTDKNVIKIWCVNSKGYRSLKDQLEVYNTVLDKEVNLYVATIAVSIYEDETYNLKYPVKDAKDLLQALELDTLNYTNVYMKSFYNSEVTKTNLNSLSEFFQQAKTDDVVILFISGHGLLDDKSDFYFASHNMDFDKPSLHGLSYQSIEQILKDAPARKRLMLMDACHSGEVDRDGDSGSDSTGFNSAIVSGYATKGGKVRSKNSDLGLQNSFNLMKELFADVSDNTGIQVISAASGDSYALESDQWQNGVFTYSILYGLMDKRADLNLDGEVMVGELRDFVIDEVYKRTNGKQKPTVRSENIEFDFKLK